MENFSLNQAYQGKIWTSADQPLIKSIVEQIENGSLTQREACRRYAVSRYQVNQWVAQHGEEISRKRSLSLDAGLRSEILSALYCRQLTYQQACQQYDVDYRHIQSWIRAIEKGSLQDVFLEDPRTAVAAVKYELVQKIRLGELTAREVARRYHVTRYEVHKWVVQQSVFNLDGSICYRIYHTMTPVQQNKELLEQIKRLQTELEDARLRNESLEMLIRVAEERYKIPIKKKRGRKRSKE